MGGRGGEYLRYDLAAVRPFSPKGWHGISNVFNDLSAYCEHDGETVSILSLVNHKGLVT